MKKSSEILSLVVFLFLISSQIFPTSLDTTIPLIIFNNYNCFLLSWKSVPVAWAPCPHSGAAAHHSNFFSTRQAPKIFANDFLRAVSPPRQHTVLVPFDLASRFFSLSWLLFSGLSDSPEHTLMPRTVPTIPEMCPQFTKYHRTESAILPTTRFPNPILLWATLSKMGWRLRLLLCGLLTLLSTSYFSFLDPARSSQMPQINNCQQTSLSARTWPANNRRDPKESGEGTAPRWGGLLGHLKWVSDL